MSNPFHDSDAVIDLHERLGWDGVAYNDAGSTPSSDWVDRSAETDDFDGGEPITIRIEWPRNPDERRDESGREVWGDCVIVVNPAEATFTDGDDDTLATEIEDGRADRDERYRVLRVRDSETGVLRLDAEELT